ncbi:hypothetical protein Rcae01_00743 [Novipirellula caenicola]|uniref:Uncharacterized protein n=1 Tax=Novipirellula caenicola TaxID=1536901 RepID=A0ABP9VJB5_9BACT
MRAEPDAKVRVVTAASTSLAGFAVRSLRMRCPSLDSFHRGKLLLIQELGQAMARPISSILGSDPLCLIGERLLEGAAIRRPRRGRITGDGCIDVRAISLFFLCYDCLGF